MNRLLRAEVASRLADRSSSHRGFDPGNPYHFSQYSKRIPGPLAKLARLTRGLGELREAGDAPR